MANNARDGWAEVDGLRTHYLKAGEGNAPVLLLHGGGYDSASLSYKHAIGSISRHHQVFAPDWPGYGQSDKPEIEYSTEYYVGFLGRLMDVLGLKKANLVGISMGGAISLGFGLRSPERVQKLVLVDSHGLGKEVPGRVMSYVMMRLPLLNKLVWGIMGRNRRMIRCVYSDLLDEGKLNSVFHNVFRNYDPERNIAIFQGERYELRPMFNEVEKLWQK